MTQAKGSLSQTAMYDESTFGTAPAGGNGLRLPVIKNDLRLEQPLKESEALQGNRNPSMPYLDDKKVVGSVVVQAEVRSLPHIFRHAFGAAVTTGPVSGTYTHTFKPGQSLATGITFEKFFSDITVATQYVGCKINGMSFELTPSGVLKITLDVMGADETSTARIDATPALYAIQPMKLGSLTFTQGGVALLTSTRFNFNFSNELEGVPTLGSGGKITSMNEGFARPTFSLSVLFESMAQYNKAKNETEDSILISIPSPSGATHKFEIEMQEVRYAVSSAPIEGPGGILCTLDGQAYYDDGAGASSVIARVANDVASVATIPA